MNEGYAATQILSQLHSCVLEKDIPDMQKSAIAEKMAVRVFFYYHFSLVESLYSLTKIIGLFFILQIIQK